MNISFPIKSAYDFDRGAVAFPAIVDGVPRRVLVSEEALQDHFGATGTGDYVQVFEQNRSAMEKVARRYIPLIKDGDVVLQTAHF